MLERTAAAGLEPSRLQRLFTRSTNPNNTNDDKTPGKEATARTASGSAGKLPEQPDSRNALKSLKSKPFPALHAALLHHGASHLDLVQVCQATTRTSSSSNISSGTIPRTSTTNMTADDTLREYLEMFTPNPAKREPLSASTFLLDFLYPMGTLTFMQKLSAGGRPQPPGAVPSVSHPATSLTVRDGRRTMAQASGSTAVAELEELLQEHHYSALVPDNNACDRAWELYSLLRPKARTAEMKREVLLFFARSRRQTEAHRLAHVFSELEPADYDAETVSAAIKVLLGLHKKADALSVFEKSLSTATDAGPEEATATETVEAVKTGESPVVKSETPESRKTSPQTVPKTNSVAGLEWLVAYALQTSSWDFLANVWSIYHTQTGRTAVDATNLEVVFGLPNFFDRLKTLAGIVDRQDGESNKPAVHGSSHPWESLQEASKAQNTEAKRPPAPQTPPAPTLSDPAQAEALRSAYRVILRAALHHLDPHKTYALVQRFRSSRVYEDFIHVAISARQKGLAARAYREYRTLPGFRPGYSTLQAMVRDVFYPDDARGMEDVLKDWYSVRTQQDGAKPGTKAGRLNHWAFQKYLAFYAARGDVTSVYRLWNEFTEAYPGALTEAEDTFAHLLKVHAVRGDLVEVERVFAEIKDVHHQEPNTICWNIRLHCYVQRRHYHEAMQIFADLCSAVAPDTYSFGTIMALAGARGDLPMVLDLYRLASDQLGLQPDVAMLAAVVEAFCQNDRFDEAEMMCERTTREGTVVAGASQEHHASDQSGQRKSNNGRRRRSTKGPPSPSQYAPLWNTLLTHHAYRHDLVTINRLLQTMTALDVSYDDDTYQALLFALAQCRQSRRAAELLRAAQEDGFFRPKAHHYTMLMMAYLRSRQPNRALQVNRLMHRMGFQQSSQQIQFVIKAFSQWQEFRERAASSNSNSNSNTLDAMEGSHDSRDDMGKADAEHAAATRRELFAKALREFQRSLEIARGNDTAGRGGRTGSTGSSSSGPIDSDAVRLPLGDVRRFSFVAFMLVQARDFAGVEEIMQLYRMLADDYQSSGVAPLLEGGQNSALPLKLCNAMMLSDFYEGNFDRVKEMWRYVLTRTVEIGQPVALRDTRLEEILGVKTANDTDEVAAATADSSLSSSSSSPQTIVAKLRYGLSDPLKTMQRLYTAEQDADGLIAMVDEVRAAGFSLDSKNWNHYVQNLARLGRIEEAFRVCEEQLMDQWSGFAVLRARRRGSTETRMPAGAAVGRSTEANNALSSSPSSSSNITSAAREAATAASFGSSARLTRTQQLLESATRFNRPMTYTFMVMAKAYLSLEQLAPWSSAAERQFNSLAIRYPKSVHAVRTMVRTNSRIEGRVFDDGEALGDFGQDVLGISVEPQSRATTNISNIASSPIADSKETDAPPAAYWQAGGLH